MSSADRRRPILITGIPRSGTTWLARILATAPRTGWPGREPMNPRHKQFGLAGEVDTWVRRENFSTRETRALRRAFKGHEPRTYGRQGRRRWAAALPWSRVITKDPFALLSLPAVCSATGALPILVYRHPAAVLASYRRMGWRADTAEFAALGGPPDDFANDRDAMASFWSWGHEVALDDLDRLPDAIVVSHLELTIGGPAAQQVLFDKLDLELPSDVQPRIQTAPMLKDWSDFDPYGFDRPADKVAADWRAWVDIDDIAAISESTEQMWKELQRRRLELPTSMENTEE